jgi:hypothetical protein
LAQFVACFPLGLQSLTLHKMLTTSVSLQVALIRLVELVELRLELCKVDSLAWLTSASNLQKLFVSTDQVGHSVRHEQFQLLSHCTQLRELSLLDVLSSDCHEFAHQMLTPPSALVPSLTILRL